MSIASAASPLMTRIDMPLSSRLIGKQQATEHSGAMSAGAVNSGEADFINLIGQSVGEVNSLQQQSTESVHEMLTGGDVQPAEVFASVQKADMAFRMLLQVRNKLMQAYEEVNAIRI